MCLVGFQFDCSVQAGDDFIALSPLLQRRDNYIATNSLVGGSDPDATFYLSLCAPLRPIPHVLCPAGAGACMVTASGDAKVALVLRLQGCVFVLPSPSTSYWLRRH